MSGVAHADRAHARLSASGSKRWMSCPGSVTFEALFPDQTTTFAEEGTAAHELAELRLRLHLELISKKDFNKQLKVLQAGPYYSQEMEDHVQTYLDIVIERINAARALTPDAIVLLEQRLDYSEWVPDGFGTGDVLIIADSALEIIDLKYGKGVPVSAEDNSQMRLFGLGAIGGFGFLYEFETIRMTIVQPRLDSVSSDELSADDLLRWADAEVRPAAQLALSGRAPMAAGDHCQFCKARSVCRTRAEANLELAKHEFQEPPMLSHDEIADVLEKVDALVKWAGDVKAYALEQAEKHGVRFPGWKLVEGRSNRIFTDKQAVADTLLVEGFEEGTIYKPREILGITEMEKAVGKKLFGDLLSGLVVKPAGKPTLVPESDKRPELSSAASAAADFAEDLE